MANWEKLNKEFDTFLDNFSDVDWENWMSVRDAKKSMRRLELTLKAKMQEEKLLINSVSAIQLYFDTVTIANQVAYKNIVKVSGIDFPASDSYAMAA